MGVNGNYVATFKDANLAVVSDISMNADYPHFWFDVVGWDGKHVTIENRDQRFTLPIHKGRKGMKLEYVVIEQSSSFERFTHRPPTKFKVHPFKGQKF